MFADILERPVELLEADELGALGAAMFAGIGSGLYRDNIDAISKCVRVKQIFEPDYSKVDTYRKIYKRWEHIYEVVNKQIYIN